MPSTSSKTMSFAWFPDLRTVLLCASILLVLRWFFKKPKNLPPGPWSFPIIGSLPTIMMKLRQITGPLPPITLLQSFADKYGPIFRLEVFNKTVIFFNDFSSLKEAFQHPQLNDRPPMLLNKFIGEGVVTSSGDTWVQLRRFCLTVLRSFGVGKSTFEEKIGTEVKELMGVMSAFDGKPFQPKSLISNAVANVVCTVVFGERYEYTDKTFQGLIHTFEENFKLQGAGGIIGFFPILCYMPFLTIGKLASNLTKLREFMMRIVDDHRATFDANNVRDLTDAHLMETMKKNSQLKDGNICPTMINIFAAGSETTGTTLQWCLLYMIFYPDVQKKVRAEIDRVVGRNRLPKMADKPELNFTQAVIWEVQRISIAPFGLVHAAASDTNIRGFLIPKGSFLVGNFWAISHDPKIWPEPNTFKPERFLNDKGDALQSEELLPFSIGRRSCIGEHLAKMELFLFFSYFMHQFRFQKPEDSSQLTLQGTLGLSYAPEPFSICAFNRE